MASKDKGHWNRIYAQIPIDQLSWYEEEPTPSLQLVEKCGIYKSDLIVDIGSGASTLIPRLLALGYRNIYAVDISDVAIGKARDVLGEKSREIHWMVDDVTHPKELLELREVSLWHDRAVFHFLTEEQQRLQYLSTVKRLVKTGGFVIIATFALDAPDKCSGLPVQRYSVENLVDTIGEGFELAESLNYTYTMPSGYLRPYIYAVLRKTDR